MTLDQNILEYESIKIFESTPVAMLMVDKQGSILYGNSQAVVLFGYPKDELLELNVEKLMPESYRMRHVKHRENYFLSPHTRPMGMGIELYGMRKNREIFPIEISLSPLETSNGIVLAAIRDISERKKTEKQLAELNRLLQDSARKAGMAETANFVLHHLGNVLTSLHISVETLLKQTKQSTFTTECEELATLINENVENLNDYVTKDNKGKLIPEYLKKLAEMIKNEYDGISNEVEHLNKKLNFVIEIVFEQRLIGKSSIVDETFSIIETIDSAIKIVDFVSSNIDIQIDTGNIALICADKYKVLQILINLILNAKHSLQLSNKINKTLSITVKKSEDNRIEICINDNGIGIAAENIIKIFSFGFISNEGRHSFGLQNSAFLSTKMGGSLNVKSEGINTGASFILMLPLK